MLQVLYLSQTKLEDNAIVSLHLLVGLFVHRICQNGVDGFDEIFGISSYWANFEMIKFWALSPLGRSSQMC